MTSNKYIYILLSALAVFLLGACGDDLVKSDYDYEFNPSVSLAEIRLNSLEKVSDEAVSLDATITKTGESEIYDQGFIMSEDQGFSEYSTISIDRDTVGSELKVTVGSLGITQGKTIYFKAFVLTKDGFVQSSETKSVNLPVTWVRVADVEFTDNTFYGETFMVELQKFEGQNRYRLALPNDLANPGRSGDPQYLEFELDEQGNALPEKMIDGAYDVSAAGYTFYWDSRFYPDYCNFVNSANVYTISFVLDKDGGLYIGGEFIFEWVDGYPGEIPEPKLSNFNNLIYTDIPGELGEFNSKAFHDQSWEQTISKAVDLNEADPESQYKNLYYLADLYVEGKGLAFYLDGNDIIIPSSQLTGVNVKEDLYVSQSEVIPSTVTTTQKGVKVYSFGLNFHYADGTSLGDFEETFYYSEQAVSYAMDDFFGSYILTAKSPFGEADAAMEVAIQKGANENEFEILGVDLASPIIATFNPETSVMSIPPQKLPDFGKFDITLLSISPEFEPSAELVMDFSFTMKGELTLTAESAAIGYILNSEAAGGWIDGYYDLRFIPAMASATQSENAVASKVLTVVSKSIVAKRDQKEDKLAKNNFSIQSKQTRRSFTPLKMF